MLEHLKRQEEGMRIGLYKMLEHLKRQEGMRVGLCKITESRDRLNEREEMIWELFAANVKLQDEMLQETSDTK